MFRAVRFVDTGANRSFWWWAAKCTRRAGRGRGDRIAQMRNYYQRAGGHHEVCRESMSRSALTGTAWFRLPLKERQASAVPDGRAAARLAAQRDV